MDEEKTPPSDTEATAGKDQDPAPKRAWWRRPVIALGATTVLIVVVGGALLLNRSEEPYGEQVDQLCADVSARFADDLDLGDEFGDPEDLEVLDERIGVLEGLRNEAEDIDVPGGTARPTDWLSTLDAHIEQAQAFLDAYRQYQPGQDMLLVMMSNDVDTSAHETGRAAENDGLDDCSDVESWELIPGGPRS